MEFPTAERVEGLGGKGRLAKVPHVEKRLLILVLEEASELVDGKQSSCLSGVIVARGERKAVSRDTTLHYSPKRGVPNLQVCTQG